MKIIFISSSDFGLECFNSLNKKHTIAGIITVPDKKFGRGQNIKPTLYKKISSANNINLLQPKDINSEKVQKWISELKPDIIIVIAYGQKLDSFILNFPKYGCINVHASFLPYYRGATPIRSVLFKGAQETGISIIRMNETIDAGEIIYQKKISIDTDENYGSLFLKLQHESVEVLNKALILIEKNTINAIPQNKNDVTSTHKFSKSDFIINWNNSALNIHNKIKGSNPTPGAATYFKNKTIKIYVSRLTDILSESKPGNTYIENKKLFVNTKDYLIEIIELKPEGKRKITATDFINGYRINTGSFFTNERKN